MCYNPRDPRHSPKLPDDPMLHVCLMMNALMTYASDMTLLDSVLLAHGLSWVDGRTTGASLDHAMWFHGTFRADRWLLYAQDTPFTGGARGLAHGQVFTQDGELVVSVMQEGLIRITDSPTTECLAKPPELTCSAYPADTAKPHVKKRLPNPQRVPRLVVTPNWA